MTTYPCQFTPAHGVFVTGTVLAKHYEEMHADVYVPPAGRRRVTCTECGADLSYGSFAGHRQKHHNGLGSYIDDGGASATHRGMSGPPPARPVPAVAPRAVTAHPTADRQRGARLAADPWTVDDIVMPVIEQLASPAGLVPVATLGALFVWRDATAAMLRAVSGEP